VRQQANLPQQRTRPKRAPLSGRSVMRRSVLPVDVLWDAIRAGAAQLAAGIGAFVQRVDHLLSEAARFGERGWPLHPEWDSADLASLVDALAGGEFDAVFLQFYEADDGARIQSAFAALAASESMSRWRLSLLQAEEAMDRQHYAIIVPALISILEGRVFFEPTGPTAVKDRVRAIAGAQADDFSRLVWQTIVDYFNALFASVDFRKDEPHCNRHWVLHGRSSVPWQRGDVVRLLHGIYTIDSALRSPHNTTQQPTGAPSGAGG